MGKEKDLSEKLPEDNNDVFADIVNGFVFGGKQIVQPDDLQNTALESMYRSIHSGTIRSQERDIAKLWVKKGVKIALCGLENQTKIDRYMPMRITGYEGASYRDMLKSGKSDVYPVLSLVLYFGDQPWEAPKTISGIVADQSYPKEMDAFLNDAKANICEVAFLSKEKLDRFHSDFRIAANFFVHKREDPRYTPDDPTTIKHVEDILCLLSAVTKDPRYQEIRSDKNFEEVHNMCDVAERLENRGKEIGMAKGRKIGITEGQSKGTLLTIYRHTAAGYLPLDVAVKEASEYGIKDEDDFFTKALQAGYKIKKK